MRIECDICGETFKLKENMIVRGIVKDPDIDKDRCLEFVYCPYCEQRNIITDGIKVEMAKEKERYE